jgi:hypothetical protein
MYVLALVLFIGGMVLFGISFTFPLLQPLLFITGILCISASLALPIHFTRRG